jgi:septal ring factor EnvC (AmiA/AmiB activator)
MSPTEDNVNEAVVTEKTGLPRWVGVLFVVAFALLGWLCYAAYSQNQALHRDQDTANKKMQALSDELDKTNGRFADLKGQLEVTEQKLGLTEDELARARSLAQNVRKQQRASDAKFRKALGDQQADTANKFGQVNSQLSSTQTDLSATKADLASTKNRLMSTIGDLGVQSGLIARNHSEVEELRAMGERDIFEFTLQKSKHMQHVGPIQMELRKVDQKHYRYTMNVLADDKNIEKKNKDVDEPVQFYVQGARAPYEIVIFKLGKNEAHGYLSTPKTATQAPPAAPGKTPAGNTPGH